MKYIYKIVNQINGKVYIGQTKDLKKRFDSYKYISNRGSKNPSVKGYHYIHKAFNKYGMDNFIVYVINSANTQKRIDELEIAYIAYYNSTNHINGYNYQAGGQCIVKYNWTDEQIKMVNEVKRLYLKENLPYAKIEKKVNLKRTAISKIILGQTFKDIITIYDEEIKESIKNRKYDPKSKLSKTDIQLIFKQYFKFNLRFSQIAKNLNISVANVGRIINGEMWKNEVNPFFNNKKSSFFRKLTINNIPDIKRLYFKDKKTCEEISKLFNVNKVIINSVISGKKWSHIYNEFEPGLPQKENTRASKLHNEDIIKIRKMYFEDKLSYVVIANKFAVNRNSISNIIKGITWKHIP